MTQDTKRRSVKPGRGSLVADARRLAEETGVPLDAVYAYALGAPTFSGGSSWLDRGVSPDVQKHLTVEGE